MKITRESWILAGICIVDLMTTIWFVRNRGAAEGNPVMSFYLERGIGPFVLAKLTLFLGPLAVLEWARRRHPRFVQSMMRTAVVLYICLYGMVVWRINRPVRTAPSLEQRLEQQLAERRWISSAITREEIVLARKERGFKSL